MTRMDESLRDAMILHCERQLAGAVADAEARMSEITANFSRIRALSTAIGGGGAPGEALAELGQRIDAVVMGMQFFDEHSQRVQHVNRMLDLLIGSPELRARPEVPADWRPFMEQLRALLSTESEWRIFSQVFPGEDAGHHPGDDVELF